ncbi:PTS sugar transporter subunit IIA [Enterobacter sp. SES19]|uniref:PTS sugar transporter subunit IIA n=1 Tax=Enterobacter TaxID=547 RepID=UPI0008E4C935|nr:MULTISPECIES: PTS sugar transporter subunit IIA [Enterobacter]MCK6904917.1 PTS sugar transporter subunit IIA [Enterobacter roggenkampii]MCX8288927.1 PTS sugar transporter subunit IIA [Enterobacter pseudoroggenkampii]QIR23851.1 PTS sugar transporter subunit IIA [Enterobacter sp. SES19]SFI70628.1 PTS system, ascorbate-specific IIA component [Enterobacter sp. NFIX59]
MLKKWIYDTTITLQESVENWPQALELCAKPLLDLQVIEPEYVTAIIQQHHTLGPYYVLAPGLAMPHARPEEGAKGLGLSLLKLKQGVSFGAGEFDPVNVIIMLAAPDKNSHIEMISSLAELFSSDTDMDELHQVNTLEEIKTIINRF